MNKHLQKAIADWESFADLYRKQNDPIYRPHIYWPHITDEDAADFERQYIQKNISENEKISIHLYRTPRNHFGLRCDRRISAYHRRIFDGAE